MFGLNDGVYVIELEPGVFENFVKTDITKEFPTGFVSSLDVIVDIIGKDRLKDAIEYIQNNIPVHLVSKELKMTVEIRLIDFNYEC